MSFRGRLLLFFTIIVVVPMIAVALVLFSLTEDSEHGKVDARLLRRSRREPGAHRAQRVTGARRVGPRAHGGSRLATERRHSKGVVARRITPAERPPGRLVTLALGRYDECCARQSGVQGR